MGNTLASPITETISKTQQGSSCPILKIPKWVLRELVCSDYLDMRDVCNLRLVNTRLLPFLPFSFLYGRYCPDLCASDGEPWPSDETVKIINQNLWRLVQMKRSSAPLSMTPKPHVPRGRIAVESDTLYHIACRAAAHGAIDLAMAAMDIGRGFPGSDAKLITSMWKGGPKVAAALTEKWPYLRPHQNLLYSHYALCGIVARGDFEYIDDFLEEQELINGGSFPVRTRELLRAAAITRTFSELRLLNSIIDPDRSCVDDAFEQAMYLAKALEHGNFTLVDELPVTNTPHASREFYAAAYKKTEGLQSYFFQYPYLIQMMRRDFDHLIESNIMHSSNPVMDSWYMALEAVMLNCIRAYKKVVIASRCSGTYGMCDPAYVESEVAKKVLKLVEDNWGIPMVAWTHQHARSPAAEAGFFTKIKNGTVTAIGNWTGSGDP